MNDTEGDEEDGGLDGTMKSVPRGPVYTGELNPRRTYRLIEKLPSVEE